VRYEKGGGRRGKKRESLPSVTSQPLSLFVEENRKRLPELHVKEKKRKGRFQPSLIEREKREEEPKIATEIPGQDSSG